MQDRILLLRYSDAHGIDTISEHKAVINECGSCYWAKIGKQPRPVYLSTYLAQQKRMIFLSSGRALHVCLLKDVRWQRPEDKYPLYYNEEIFGKSNEPHLFFQIESMEKAPFALLDDYVVCNSYKPVSYDLKKTISSYMFIQHKDAPREEKKQQIRKHESVTPKVEKRNNTCKYLSSGLCSNKRSVNYQYECIHPQSCIKRSRL